MKAKYFSKPHETVIVYFSKQDWKGFQFFKKRDHDKIEELKKKAKKNICITTFILILFWYELNFYIRSWVFF